MTQFVLPITSRSVFKRLTVLRFLSQIRGGGIFAGEDENGEIFRVKFTGDIALEPGDIFDVRGFLGQFRDRFGRFVNQIKATKMTRVAVHGALIGPLLQRLPNIGPERARRLSQTFGVELPRVLQDLSKLSEVALAIEPSKPALAARIAMQVYSAVAICAGADALRCAEIEFLATLESLGLRDSRVAGFAWRYMAGVDAVQTLKRNPYLLSTMLPWQVADKIGLRILEQSNDGLNIQNAPARLCGAVQSVWRNVLADGHTAITPEGMRTALESLNVSSEDALGLATEKRLLIDSGDLFRAPGAAWLENQILAAITAIETYVPAVEVPKNQIDRVRITFEAECKVGFTLNQEQQEAVARLLSMPVAGLHGGAGVGKTTVMRVLAETWESLGGNVVLCAIAGKAALSLSRGASSSSRPRLAFTVARLIGMLERSKGRNERPAQKGPSSDVEFNEKTLLVIDESGMLDTPSLHRLLTLLPEGGRVLFAGDVGQLPPVGIGAFFRDLVIEGSRVITLTKVLRQAAGSAIPLIAGQIREGLVPILQLWSGEEEGVYLIPPNQLFDLQRQLRKSRETLVVAALRKTVALINNTEAFDRKDAGCVEVRVAPEVYVAVGDPVVMNSNRYAEGLYNGQLGVVTAIGERITVKWDGNANPTELTPESAADIDLAYAITCHKAQGSAADTVIVAVEKSPVVTREWLYTAVTRSRRLVLLAADLSTIRAAVDCRTDRVTGMRLGPQMLPLVT